ncbi:MAG: hypothetical protein WCT31_01610 [Candidatus Micrarchaeia archaeon]|jgi:hypothetical protein
MDKNAKIVLGIGIIVGFVVLVALLVLSYITVSDGMNPNPISSFIMGHHVEFMIVTSFLGILVGAGVYYLLKEEVAQKEIAVCNSAMLVMKFLSKEEREIIELISEKEGMTTQAEISKLPGMTRLKAHRIVGKMEKKGLVFVEKYGKVNMVRLVNELKDALATGKKE